jgi:ABC-type transport system substrate-binding protein
MKEAGIDGAPLTLVAQSTGFFPLEAEVLQKQLNAVGFKVTINKVDGASFYPTLYDSKYDIAGDQRRYVTPDPDNLLSPILYSKSVNGSKALALDTYPNAAEWDKILDDARQVLDHDKARPLYATAQRWLQDNLPISMLAYFSDPIAISKRLHDLDAAPMAALGLRVKQAWLE